MLARLLNFILTRTALGRYLDGKKTLLSAALIVAAGVLKILEALAPLFPDAAFLVVGAEELQEFLDASAVTLGSVGLGGVVIGLGHKAAKAKLPEE